MTNKETRELLVEHFGSDDDTGHVTLHKGVWTVREGFYYTHGRTPEMLAENVRDACPGVTVVDTGTHNAPFRGGAGVRASSHFWVKFTVKPGTKLEKHELPRHLF
jgi:hypothetical protein